MLDIVKTEIREVADKYGDERRTEISAFTGDVDDEDLIPVEDCILTLTERGYIKRQTVDTYKAQNRGGKGIMGMSRREEDVAKNMFTCSTHDAILIFTNMGKVFKLKGYQIPEASRTSKGMNVINLLPIEQDEKVTAMVKVPKDSDREYLCMVTRNGVIKRTALDQYNNIRKQALLPSILTKVTNSAGLKSQTANAISLLPLMTVWLFASRKRTPVLSAEPQEV